MPTKPMDTLIHDNCMLQEADARKERAVRWLAERLSEARVMPSWKRCHDCAAYSFESCTACWTEAALEAAREVKNV